MLYSAVPVANELLERAAVDGVSLTQINIQKLVYFAHGWHLGWSGNPLISNLIEAWQYGPVVRVLYDQFRRFGSSPITERAVELSIATDGEVITSASTINDPYAKSVIGAVWKEYGRMQPFKLVELTHVVGSPWETAWRSRAPFIKNEDIRQYFAGLATSKE